MITGSVTLDNRAIIVAQLQGPADQVHQIEAIIDTGFDGSLTLPPRLTAEYGLEWRGRGRALLADGSDSIFDLYEATVIWDGHSRLVPVDEVDITPLVGMALMQGYQLQIQVIKDGAVTLELL